MSYSQEFVNNVVSRLFSHELSVRVAAEKYHISKTTISAWKRKAMARSQDAMNSQNTEKNSGSKSRLRLLNGVSYLAAHEAVIVKSILNDEEFGKYCRERGLLASEITQWSTWFKKHPHAVDAEELNASREQLMQAQGLIRQKDKELSQKDKALANTATMLMLSKKARAIWGDKES